MHKQTGHVSASVVWPLQRVLPLESTFSSISWFHKPLCHAGKENKEVGSMYKNYQCIIRISVLKSIHEIDNHFSSFTEVTTIVIISPVFLSKQKTSYSSQFSTHRPQITLCHISRVSGAFSA